MNAQEDEETDINAAYRKGFTDGRMSGAKACEKTDQFMHFVGIARAYFESHDLEVSETTLGHLAVMLCKAHNQEKITPYE